MYTAHAATGIEPIDLRTGGEYDSLTPEDNLMATPKLAAKPADSKPHWTWWITTGLVVVALVGGAVWTLHEQFSKIDKHISRVEMAVRIVGAKQGGDTKTLIDEALTVAKLDTAAGRTENARVVIDIANRLIAEQTKSRREAPSGFFDNALTTYTTLKQSPELANSAWKGTVALAEYRSAVAMMPADFHPASRYGQGSAVDIGSLERVGHFWRLTNSLISGPQAIQMGDEEGFVIDGFLLDNVVFEDTTIIYKGGPVSLRNVQFVNCRFDVKRRSPQAEQLLRAVVTQPADVQIG